MIIKVDEMCKLRLGGIVSMGYEMFWLVLTECTSSE